MVPIMKESIAITFQENDCLRIIPMRSKNGNAEIKFHFFDDLYRIRKFNLNKEKGGLIYSPVDHGKAEHEISYHSANDMHKDPILLPKYKSGKERKAISSEIISLDLSGIIAPIPICRITANIPSDRKYKTKSKHCLIELTDKYNTIELYIAGRDYDLEGMSNKYPMVLGFIFNMTTIDSLIYGAGFSVEPNYNKMIESRKPVVSLQSAIIEKYQFFFRTYQLSKYDQFRIYSKKEYSNNNFIEFFNNIDYFELLATTNIAYKTSPTNITPIKAAYEYDLDALKKSGCRRKFIRELERKLSKKKKKYEKLNKFRSGLIINRE